MGTSLTGLTPATTYDALIKVGDNGPLSATAKVLSDGLGNDSVLALSTSNVGIGTTNANRLLVVQQNSTNTYNSADPTTFNQIQAVRNTTSGTGYNSFLTFASEPNGEWYLGSINKSNFSDFVIVSRDATYGERMRITSAGNVGIGTSSPNRKLAIQANGTTSNEQVLFLKQPDDFGFSLNLDAATTGNLMIKGVSSGTESASIVTLRRDNLRVGINNDAPAVPLDVVGNIRTSTGILFGSDTAAANALDDYEEGTWTMGVSFGGANTGVTYSINTGAYTLIGRQVTVTGYCVLTSKGSSTGNARITGLPFTIAGAASNYSSPTLYLENISFANAFQGFGVNGSTTIALYETTEAGSVTVLDDTNFSNSSAFIINFSYFV